MISAQEAKKRLIDGNRPGRIQHPFGPLYDENSKVPIRARTVFTDLK